MTTILPRSLLLALCVSASPLLAQTSTPATTNQTDSAASKKRNRAISGEASAALSAGYSYQPPKPVAPTPEDVDQRELDKPRNEIIRLPKYMVEGVKPPVFAEPNMYTKQDFSKLVTQRFFGGGINKYQLGKTGEAYAMQNYWDEQRLQNMMEGDRQVSLYRAAGDEGRAAKTEAENKSMFLRTNDASSAELSKQAGQRY